MMMMMKGVKSGRTFPLILLFVSLRRERERKKKFRQEEMKRKNNKNWEGGGKICIFQGVQLEEIYRVRSFCIRKKKILFLPSKYELLYLTIFWSNLLLGLMHPPPLFLFLQKDVIFFCLTRCIRNLKMLNQEKLMLINDSKKKVTINKKNQKAQNYFFLSN